MTDENLDKKMQDILDRISFNTFNEAAKKCQSLNEVIELYMKHVEYEKVYANSAPELVPLFKKFQVVLHATFITAFYLGTQLPNIDKC